MAKSEIKSDSESSHDAPRSLLSRAAHEANARADATFLQMTAASVAETLTAQRVGVGGDEPIGDELRPPPQKRLPKSPERPPRNKIPKAPWRSETSTAQVAAPAPKFSSAASSTASPSEAAGQAHGQLKAEQQGQEHVKAEHVKEGQEHVNAEHVKAGQQGQEHGQEQEQGGRASSRAIEEQDASADCPRSLLVHLEWEHVLWYTNPKTGKMVYDTKNSPVPLPHPNMEFRGYVENDEDTSVSALFVNKTLKGDKTRQGQPGTRLPRPAGGARGESKRQRSLIE